MAASREATVGAFGTDCQEKSLNAGRSELSVPVSGLMSSPGWVPFYFGAPERLLFGCFHRPKTGTARDAGVVLCSPTGNECISAHRAYRQLAIRLADSGFPVLRFDYYGYGDSSGDESEAGIPQQLADISIAIRELREKAGLAKVCLMGLRFGATLSMIVGAERGDVEDLVLWDPVVNGRAYIEDMRGLHNRTFGYTNSMSKHSKRAGVEMELFGFPLTASLLEDLEKIDLLLVRGKPARNVLVITTHAEAKVACLSEHLRQTEARVEFQSLQAANTWWAEFMRNLLVPSQVLKSVVSWISELHS